MLDITQDYRCVIGVTVWIDPLDAAQEYRSQYVDHVTIWVKCSVSRVSVGVLAKQECIHHPDCGEEITGDEHLIWTLPSNPLNPPTPSPLPSYLSDQNLRDGDENLN